MPIWSQTQDTLARTIWGEARGGGGPAMGDIASVILNRAADGHWPRQVGLVCHQPWQFSCWNIGDPNHEKLLAVTDADPSFDEALHMAGEALAGTLVDRTEGADAYYAVTIPPPYWTRSGHATIRLWQHQFWRLYDPKPYSAPNISSESADDLNARELAAIASRQTP